MKTLTKKIWFVALLAASLVAQSTNNLNGTYFHEFIAPRLVERITNILDSTQSRPAEDTTYYSSEIELDSILEELSYNPIIPRGFHSSEAAAEMICYLMESDTDSKYINIFYSREHDMLNIVVYYDDEAKVELYGVTHSLESIHLATYQTKSRNSLWFVIEQNNHCFKGYEVVLRSKKLYRNMYRYMVYLGC